MELKFRKLRADEIDCRISTCNQYGVGLLLYKDARCDQNILDETVGAMNWERHHSRDNANCIVSIWDEDKKQWVEKEDTGTESNTEKEKGLASDSFKRACFNWGIGRELYTAPPMFVFGRDLKTLKQEGARYTCRDSFSVDTIEYDDQDRIAYVKVINRKTGGALEFGAPVEAQKEYEKTAKQQISITKAKALLKRCANDGVDPAKVAALYKVDCLPDITETQHKNIIDHWKDVVARCKP